MRPETQQIVKDGLLKEYDFVESLIPLYRQFQVQLLRYGFLVYTAVLGLIVASFQTVGGTNSIQRIAYAAIALLPFLISLLLFVFLTTEIRIKRASVHIQKIIAPKIKQLSNGFDVLTWESSPGLHLTEVERKLSTSTSLVYSLALPVIAGGVWYIPWYFCTKEEIIKVIPWWVALIGLILVILASYSSSKVSAEHERR